MYIPQPVKIKLKDGVVETAGGIRKITVVFMELLDVEIAVSDDKNALDHVWAFDGPVMCCFLVERITTAVSNAGIVALLSLIHI